MRSGKFRGLRYTTKHDLEFHNMIVRLLTRQTTTIDEGLVPLRGFNIKKIKKHIENDFLLFP